MAHNLNFNDGKASMMSVGEVPWHRLGTILKDAPETVAEALKAANLDWEVGLKSIFCADGEFHYEMPERKAIVRLDHWGKEKCVPFGMVGNEYQVLQNKDAFAFFDPIVQTKKVSFETAGALGAGERVWVMAKVIGDIEIAKNDPIQRYILLSTGHDGRTAVQVRFTPVRVVCQNTLMMALESGNDFAKAYHVPGMKKTLFDAQESVTLILNKFEVIELTFKRMVAKALNDELLRQYVCNVFPSPERKKNQSEASYAKLIDSVEKSRVGAVRYYHSGFGNTDAPVKGTMWAAYNGITELVDHHTSYRDPWHRLESCWFGEAQRTKQRAYDCAVEMLDK